MQYNCIHCNSFSTDDQHVYCSHLILCQQRSLLLEKITKQKMKEKKKKEMKEEIKKYKCLYCGVLCNSQEKLNNHLSHCNKKNYYNQTFLNDQKKLNDKYNIKIETGCLNNFCFGDLLKAVKK